MEQDKRTPESKSNSTMVWFALIIAATIAVSMFLIVNQSKKTMSFANFKNLIETTQYEKLNSNKLETNAVVPRGDSAPHGVETPT